jgi:hypothetical protein
MSYAAPPAALRELNVACDEAHGDFDCGDAVKNRRSYTYPDALLAERAARRFTLADFDIGRRPIGQGKFGASGLQ